MANTPLSASLEGGHYQCVFNLSRSGETKEKGKD